MKPALLMLLLMGAYPAHAADPYKWRDQAGQLHYTDQPPPRDAQLIERPSIKGNLIEGDTLSFETRMLAQKYPVVLYVFDGCGAPCDDAKSLLTRRGIPFTLRESDADKSALRKLTGDNVIPVVTVGQQTPLKGFEANQWHELLDLAGYPRSNPLGNIKKSPTPAKTPKPD